MAVLNIFLFNMVAVDIVSLVKLGTIFPSISFMYIDLAIKDLECDINATVTL